MPRHGHHGRAASASDARPFPAPSPRSGESSALACVSRPRPPPSSSAAPSASASSSAGGVAFARALRLCSRCDTHTAQRQGRSVAGSASHGTPSAGRSRCMETGKCFVLFLIVMPVISNRSNDRAPLPAPPADGSLGRPREGRPIALVKEVREEDRDDLVSIHWEVKVAAIASAFFLFLFDINQRFALPVTKQIMCGKSTRRPRWSAGARGRPGRDGTGD